MGAGGARTKATVLEKAAKTRTRNAAEKEQNNVYFAVVLQVAPVAPVHVCADTGRLVASAASLPSCPTQKYSKRCSCLLAARCPHNWNYDWNYGFRV